MTIPTMNSAITIEKCLASIEAQTYRTIEVIVMDGGSSDRTVELARHYGAQVCSGTHLAERRLLGVKLSHGEMILMLDSDQVLSPDAVEKCVHQCATGEFDALFLTESPLSTKSIVQKALALDRRLVHRLRDTHPVFGTLLPSNCFVAHSSNGKRPCVYLLFLLEGRSQDDNLGCSGLSS